MLHLDPAAWLSPGVLGQPATTAHVVLIHGGESTARKLEQVLPGARAVAIYREGSTPAYAEASGLARDYPTIRALMAEYAPDWRPGQPLVVLAYSAGGAALRHYLRSAQDRGDVTAAIFLDSTYGASGGQCDLGPYQGVVEYGKLATAQPSSKRLIMTFSHATAGPEICARAIEQAVGGAGGVWVRDSGDSDHGAQQGIVGPAVVRDFVAPWIGGAGSSSSSGAPRRPSAALVALGAAAALALGFLITRSVA